MGTCGRGPRIGGGTQTVADANGIPAQDVPAMAEDPDPIVLREEVIKLKRNGKDKDDHAVMCVSVPPYLCV